MTGEQYEEMVTRLEGEARRDPGRYRLRVGLLAALGYSYILLVVGLLLGLSAAIVAAAFGSGRLNWLVIKVGWVVLALAWFVLRALWVRVPAPEGRELKRADAPRLFAAVEEITRAINAPRIHRVLVTGEFNASVVQLPRLGPLGWHRNYLSLGLPLMQALSPEHFRAVAAHELGHLSGNHGRFAGWIYRVRGAWLQLLIRFHQEQRWGVFLFEKFFNWYAPYFHAYSFVLARRHEYEADGAAARLAGARAAGDALIAVHTKATLLEEGYWPGVFKEADRQPQPVRGAFANLSGVLGGPVPSESAADYLRRALSEKTGHEDTHPSLSDRLAALGHPAGAGGDAEGLIESFQLAPLAESAAEHFLGPRAEAFAAEYDEDWRRSVSDDWRQRHEYVVESRKRLAALDAKAGALTPQESFEFAKLVDEFRDPAEAIAPLREVLRAEPKHAEANFMLGHILLGRDDDSGIAHLEAAMSQDSEAIVGGCQILYSYLTQKGRDDEADRYRLRAEQYFASLEASR